MRTLQSGQTGRAVVVWQRFLGQSGLGDGAPMLHGVFDEATEAGTRAFQEHYGIQITGAVDRDTHDQAMRLGLSLIDAAEPRGFGVGRLVLGIVLLVMISYLATCMVQPRLPSRLPGGAQGPLPASRVPGAPPTRPCPGWFC